MAVAIATLLVLASLAAGPDRGPVNLDLEGGTLGQVREGWSLPVPSRQAGDSARLTEDRPKHGRRLVLLRGCE